MRDDLVEKAVRIAAIAHKEQVRKTDNTPYIVHPIMCAFLLKEHGFGPEVIAAALVHDVVEDTDVTLNDLRTELGNTVADIVAAVSEDGSLAWEERKQAYVASVREASEEAKAVSIADKIHNMESLLAALDEQGEALWAKFNRGKDKKLWFEKEMLAIFEASWQHPLVERYRTLIEMLEARS